MGTTRRKVRRIFRMDLERQLCRVTSSGMRFSHKHFSEQLSSHNSSFKSAWTWFILCLTLYTAVMVPYSVAFQYNGSPQASEKQLLFWLIIDSFVDVVFIADIVVNFMTSLMSDSGEMIKDAKIIQMNYVSNWYTLDLLSCLPYDIIYFVLNNVNNLDDKSDSNSSATSLFSALKVIRLLRVARVARKMDHFAEYSGVVLMILVGAFGLFGHWLACMWFAIGINTICNEDGNLTAHNWLVRFSVDTSQEYILLEDCVLTYGPSHLDAYLAALYFVMSSLTSVGFGNIAPYSPYEQSFSVVVLIFGALLYAMIFGNVTTIISQIYADMNRYHDSLNSVREFARFNSVPQNIEARIMDFMVTTWQQTKGIDTNAVINLCPKDLKADICVHLHRRVFNGHRCFLEASDACLRSLALEFQTIHVSAGDIVYHKGEYVDEVSFVARGILEVLQDGEVIAVLSNGDAFGDNVWRRPLSHGPAKCVVYIRALSFTDIHVIKRASLKKVLGFYNDYAKSFDRELKLAVNVCESVHFRKIKRRKPKLNAADSVTGGISSILGKGSLLKSGA
ncbi:unnamed protein product [Oikopleura dioica]|uniref:Cyclic nucleotide-binding domain-containing protein n=1 Tax=Oikopleura dioica TaxID=34765 RepID=E4YG56_OIKDI|nr:unnamed protein product [Oikopleura dioica]